MAGRGTVSGSAWPVTTAPFYLSVVLFLCSGRFLHTDKYSGTATQDFWNSLLMHLLFYVKHFALPDSPLHPINSDSQLHPWVPAVSSLPTSQPRNFLKGKTGAIMGLTLHFFLFLEFTTLPHLMFSILKALSHIFYLGFQLIQMGGGRKVWEGEDICIPMVRSCWWRAERTHYCKATILQLKIHKFLKRKAKSIPCFTLLAGNKSPVTCISIFLC